MRKLLIATHNKGKFPEIVKELEGISYEIINLNSVDVLPEGEEVEEPAMTFEGNAIIKAMTIGRWTNMLTLAEDAGLEVDALNGRPGVRTARYALGTDEDKYNKLLEELKNVPKEKRNARFKAIIAIYDPINDKIRTCEGVYEGLISSQPKGKNGFGFDPIFFNIELNKTNAEMTIEEKNSVSHRGKALRLARDILIKEFSK